jgi:hypothetical protein
MMTLTPTLTLKPCHASVGALLAAPAIRAWQPLDHWASPAFRSAGVPAGSFDFRRVSAIRSAPTGYCYGNTFGRRKREQACLPAGRLPHSTELRRGSVWSAAACRRFRGRIRGRSESDMPEAGRRRYERRYKTVVARRASGIVARRACGIGGNLPGLRLDQIAANCESDQIAKTLKLHFAHDVVAMAFHRARGNAEHRGCLFVAFPARQKLHHFHLPG